jgi:hypothetical protein
LEIPTAFFCDNFKDLHFVFIFFTNLK